MVVLPDRVNAWASGHAGRWVRAVVCTALTLWYFGGVFQVSNWRLPEDGLGHWLDPYFINVVLEHWRHSVLTLSDPASPPMYFPVGGTLGYSVALVLFAPVYIAARLVLSPFQAHTATIFAAMTVGSLSLYLICRRHLRLGFIESVVLCAFFATSGNVISPHTNVWSQMASVFLIPPILLLALASGRMRTGPARVGSMALVAFLGVLLFVQDFYTGQFALLVSGAFLVAWLIVRGRRQWEIAWPPATELVAGTLGALAGIAVFLWVYLGAYLEHRGFPEDQLLSALFPIDASPWAGVSDFLDRIVVYYSGRPFTFVAVLGVAVWFPWLRTDRPTRLLSLWLVGLSAFVLLSALRIDGFSLWKTFVAPLPGLSILRDPKRIIYTYELAVVLTAGLILARLPRANPIRLGVTLLLAVVLVTQWNRQVFEFDRSVVAFRQWVQAPIAIDASCRSFFVRGASETYMSRSGHMWSLYGVDATFIALRYDIPTLNGYSAWGPEGWGLANPQEEGYLERANEWIVTHRLQGVCVLDIDARTMQPYRAPATATMAGRRTSSPMR